MICSAFASFATDLLVFVSSVRCSSKFIPNNLYALLSLSGCVLCICSRVIMLLGSLCCPMSLSLYWICFPCVLIGFPLVRKIMYSVFDALMAILFALNHSPIFAISLFVLSISSGRNLPLLSAAVSSANSEL